MLKRLLGIATFLVLTLVTQVGGAAFLFTWLVTRVLLPASEKGWRRATVNGVMFAGLYAGLHLFAVPPLAALGGRVPLPCEAQKDRPFAAGHGLYCLLNRHYVDPRMVTLMTSLSRAVERAYPGTVTLFLDAGFPVLDGFPLLPHLSHHDGRKLDIAFYYADPAGTYRPGWLRSPIGYGAFEQPGPADPSPCGGGSLLTLRWDLAFLQGRFAERPVEPERTRSALRWLVEEGRELGVERVFIEPYLAARLGVSSPLIGFQGCRAARHDDHIHVQIK